MFDVESLRLVAMRAVIGGDDEYNIRYILRWYSRSFHTPLHVVESDLPLEEVLQHYFEVRYEDMPLEERHQEIQRLLETEEERRRKRRLEDAEDAEADDFVKLTEKQIQGAPKTPMAQAASEIQSLAKNMQAAAGSIPVPTVPEVIPEIPEKLPPDIKMTFVDDDAFDELLDGGFGPPDRKPG